MVACLLVPAGWNGFPLIFADTGGYLVRPFDGTLELGRSAIYGTFLAGGIPFQFWPMIVIQGLLAAWTVALVLRAHGLGRARWAVVAIAALSVLTSLPWYVDLLIPDVFVPLAVLAFYLLAFRRNGLRRIEQIGLGAVIAFAIASHMSILGLMLVVLMALAVLQSLARRLQSAPPALLAPSLANMAGIALALASNFVIAGTPRFTPGGASFLFGRLLQDGLVKRYLDRNCPDATLQLCAYRDELPEGINGWLWADSPLNKLGGWRAFEPEAERIILGSLLQEPGLNLLAAAAATITQIGRTATGDVIDSTYNWHSEMILGNLAPGALQRYKASVQGQNLFDFSTINLVHVPIALGATALLPIILVWGHRRQANTTLVLTVLLALLTNAAICAVFSDITDRYQSRLVSIAVLAAVLGLRELQRGPPSVRSAIPEPIG